MSLLFFVIYFYTNFNSILGEDYTVCCVENENGVFYKYALVIDTIFEC